MKRRSFNQLMLAGLILPGMWRNIASAGGAPRVVVVGAGFAGATVAKYLRLWSQGRVEVTVIEPGSGFVSCPVSNLVLGGSRQIQDISRSYDVLRQHGIQMRQASVTQIDAGKRQLKLDDGTHLGYDKLVLAPGISFDYSHLNAVTGLDLQQHFLHAWKAGAQTVALKQQLQAMPDGGVFALTVPALPYRCPPGPYERACQVAYYLKQHKPRSKVLVLDANPAITSKRALFEKAWAELYPGMIEYQPVSELKQIDPAQRMVRTTFDTFRFDVLNLIPPQTAGRIALDNGLANAEGRWCDVDYVSYESKQAQHIHILGDALDSGLPKSAHIATSEAKVCASAIIDILAGQAPDPAPVFANTCYSYVSADEAMHVANVYRYDEKSREMKPAPGGGVSKQHSAGEAREARSWASNIWHDALG
ncbi:sulfide dehydrogenase (flavocytochrome c), flavoprotein subunit [Methylobacillus rhizosphaerae]|uniref:Sulfide dehydrogenase (Flavocytochrome c), flavoprotein subunit n=1 Tax=Methylobacillus rhizosphaerae TaxID=551994 RepID=A0A238ZCC6_9PROT|nr:NAD(P)/FAD-dependent oxidoreductase [Methylobacillus rhizosphaerae]SNR80364.1 sulfide dehydrogenase (flavocytochrome c), flavoprotein subunit [Methylobacillus rhizosphaerae]